MAHLRRVGLSAGWRCWEVGAGGPQLVRRRADAVGGRGSVLATDIDTSWLQGETPEMVEVRRHDVETDVAPGAGFDLVHARLVLVHVAGRHRALGTMVSALRPGGWLVVEDADPGLQPLACLDPTTAEEELANRIRSGFRRLMAERGVDLAYGRTLPRRLRQSGLEDVHAEALTVVTDPACVVLERATVALVRAPLVAAGLATEEEVERHVDNVAFRRLDLAQPPLVTAWGRAPSS